MKFNELPVAVQERLNRERLTLKDKNYNGAYEIHLYNALGTRYIYARRQQNSWSNNKGAYMPFGGGSYWNIRYGCVQFECFKNPVGEIEYRLCDGKTYGSVNGVAIPQQVNTKKKVLDVIKSIGIFNI